MAQFSPKHYFKPTPRIWRQIGDGLLAVSSFIIGFSLYNEFIWLAWVALGVGVIGKFLTNMFKENNVK